MASGRVLRLELARHSPLGYDNMRTLPRPFSLSDRSQTGSEEIFPSSPLQY